MLQYLPAALAPFRTLAVAIAAAVLAGGLSAAHAQPPSAPLTTPEKDAIVRALQAAGDVVPAGDDAELQAAAIELAKGELAQRIDPSAVDRMWSIEPARRDVAGEFASARAAGRLEPWLQSLSPPFDQYRYLLAARTRYRTIVAAGGWPNLTGKAPLREGDRGPHVRALRARLAAERYGSDAAPHPDRFDANLRLALVAFQRRHGLPEDGVVGPATLAALNVRAEDRLAQVDANLERWRWVPRNLPAQRMEIDIAGARAVILRGGTPVLDMKIVVGDPRHHTPMFASKIQAVVFNPPWNVPTSIAANEILPKARRDGGYLARNDFIWSGGRLVQQPGPKNSLGQVKFDLPSPFGVYLHDTPTRSAFSRPNRALSHGCMRLEKPRELAGLLLADLGWTAEQVDGAIATGDTRRMDLKTDLPLYVFYWTAIADADAEVEFRPDIYGWDRKLIAALPAKPVQRAALPRTGTDCVDAAK